MDGFLFGIAFGGAVCLLILGSMVAPNYRFGSDALKVARACPDAQVMQFIRNYPKNRDDASDKSTFIATLCKEQK